MRGVAATVSNWTDCDRPIMWTGASVLTLGIGFSIAFPSHRNLPLLVFVLLPIAVGTGLLFDAPLFALYSHSPCEDHSRVKAACTFVRTLGSGIGLVVGQVVLQNELITQLANSADISQDPITVLSDLSSLPLEMQEVLRPILTASLSRVRVLFTATAGLCLLVSFLIRHKRMLRQFEVRPLKGEIGGIVCGCVGYHHMEYLSLRSVREFLWVSPMVQQARLVTKVSGVTSWNSLVLGVSSSSQWTMV